MNIERQLMDEPRSIPDYADVMTEEQWFHSVKCGSFIPYDGSGHWAAGQFMDISTDVWVHDKPLWATHVAWFNK